MSLLPYLLLDEPDMWSPRRTRNYKNIEDILEPFLGQSELALARNRRRRKLLQRLGDSSVTVDKERFQANFDVQHFKPEEISVKLTGDREVTIEGEHEEQEDEHGHVYRHFVRRYILPEHCDVGRIESKLSSDGVLTITAPTAGEKVERNISITQTGKPAERAEKKEENLPVKKHRNQC